MSTPETKQAAEWTEGELHELVMDLRVETGYPENIHRKFFRLLQPWFTAHNTATAKLRESVSQWMKNHDAVCKLYQAELSKREPLVAAINRLFALVDANHYERAKAVRDAALTGTEEKT